MRFEDDWSHVVRFKQNQDIVAVGGVGIVGIGGSDRRHKTHAESERLQVVRFEHDQISCDVKNGGNDGVG